MLETEVAKGSSFQRQVSDGSKSTGSTASGSTFSLVELVIKPPSKHELEEEEEEGRNWCSQRIVMSILGSIALGVVCLALKQTIIGVLFFSIPVTFLCCAWIVHRWCNYDQANTNLKAETQVGNYPGLESPPVMASGDEEKTPPAPSVGGPRLGSRAPQPVNKLTRQHKSLLPSGTGDTKV